MVNIGNFQNLNVVSNRHRPSTINKSPHQAPSGIVQEPALEAATPTETFVPSGVSSSEATSSARRSSKSLLRSAFDTASHLVTELIPGAVGVGFNAVKDTLGGGVRDSHFEHRVSTGSEAEASQKFEEAKDRLLNPNEWKKLGPEWGAASFQVYDAQTKKPLDAPPKNGDYLKIGLPDPCKHVWVQIDAINVDDSQAEIHVRPSIDPTSNRESIAHFFSDETANIFRVSREGNEVVSSVTGVDEKLNTKNATLFDRGIQAGRLAGAWMGAKKPQWKAFSRKLIEGPQPALALQTSGLDSALETSSAALRSGAQQ